MSILLIPPYAMLVGAQRAALGGAGAAPFDPSVYGLDALDNLYAVHSVARVLTSWAGNLVRLRRSTDNIEADFGYVETTGFLDGAAITTWLAGGTAFVVTLYDQTGNGRHATQPTTSVQPTLALGGAHPVLQTDGGDAMTPPVAGFARNVGAVSMIWVGKYGSTLSNIQTGMSVNFSGSGLRAGLLRATSGNFQAGGRRLDAEGSTTLSVSFVGSNSWIVQIGRFDYANSNLYHRADTGSETLTTFATDGVTSDTDSSATGMLASASPGAIPVTSGGQLAAAIWVRDLLTDPEDVSLITSLAPLKL